MVPGNEPPPNNHPKPPDLPQTVAFSLASSHSLKPITIQCHAGQALSELLDMNKYGLECQFVVMNTSCDRTKHDYSYIPQMHDVINCVFPLIGGSPSIKLRFGSINIRGGLSKRPKQLFLQKIISERE